MSTKENEVKVGLGSEVSGYWQDVENKVLDKKFLSNEFSEDEFDSFSVKKNRRSFLKIMGFSVSALPLTGCIKIPVKKALPYLKKQDHTFPGVANWYASTFEGTPILVKTREGRPIKIEGNDKSLTFQGGVGPRQHASVFSLYDSNRLKMPVAKGSEVEWDQFDAILRKDLWDASGETYIVTSSSQSPSELRLIKEVTAKWNATHITYDAVSMSATAEANLEAFGVRSLADYHFENASTIVSFGADFLGSFGNSTANAKGYSKRRDAKNEKGMSRHFQVESSMSLTGSNADYRFTKSHAYQKDILLGVYSAIAGKEHSARSENREIIKQISKDLLANKGESLVLCGHNEKEMQVLTNAINQLLGNYNSTLTLNSNTYRTVADDAAFEAFVKKMNAGTVGAAFFVDVNPAYDYYNPAAFESGVKKVKVSVSMTLADSETSVLTNYKAPINHVFESWSDSMVTNTELSLTQPVIQPLFGTRMWTETFMSLAEMKGSFYDYIKAFWATQKLDWNQVLHDGVATINSFTKPASIKAVNTTNAIKKIKAYKPGTGMHIVTYTNSSIGNGTLGNVPWLQELPDPVTKATWDNYAMVSPLYAKEQGIKSGDVVEVSNGKTTIQLPAIVQPGTDKGTIAIALGYGRKVAGKVAKNLGANAYGMVHFSGNFHYAHSFGTLKKTGKFSALAQTQTHHSMEGRDIVRDTTFSKYVNDKTAGHPKHKPKIVHIYPEHDKSGHQWAMAINLSTCTGCSSCIISCNAENNVPVVGKQEVINRRDMHWLRLDRYYKGDENQPEVMHQPMLCQHCENAPCENVCPVLATVHSSDGLNQQIYNRCVGTRYCANNCPYKVRRFNWFNYDRGDDVQKMALNPDIGIRSRGIMEKCSMCVQRIQDGKLTAKRERRKLKDGDIKVACQQSCPSDAIVFGDMNDKDSKISAFLEDERNYTVLEELNVRPRVSYLTKIRNK